MENRVWYFFFLREREREKEKAACFQLDVRTCRIESSTFHFSSLFEAVTLISFYFFARNNKPITDSDIGAGRRSNILTSHEKLKNQQCGGLGSVDSDAGFVKT